MLTRPGQLSDAALVQALGTGWGIMPATMEYRAVGYGSHHWEPPGKVSDLEFMSE